MKVQFWVLGDKKYVTIDIAKHHEEYHPDEKVGTPADFLSEAEIDLSERQLEIIKSLDTMTFTEDPIDHFNCDLQHHVPSTSVKIFEAIAQATAKCLLQALPEIKARKLSVCKQQVE